MRFYALLLLAPALFQPRAFSARTDVSFSLTARIDNTSLASLISHARIQSFDLSPDGQTIALLVTAARQDGASLWLLIEDIRAKRVSVSSELGPWPVPTIGCAQQVRYSSDQRYLVVQDLRTIRVVDSSTLRLIRTIAPPSGDQVPLFVTGASNRDIFACAFGAKPKYNFFPHLTPAQVVLVDVSSGEILGGWASEDLPQSISPEGDLIAVSSGRVREGLFPLNVIDSHGQTVASALTGGFAFKHPDQSKPLGRVVGLFVSERELLLGPDEGFDKAGQPSGDKLVLAPIEGTRDQKSLAPARFRSQGALAVSTDKKTVLALSWYVPARYLVGHRAMPDFQPEVMVFALDEGLRLEVVLPIRSPGLGAGSWSENWLPRVSSDGSVIAIPQDRGVTVLTKNVPISATPKK